MLVVPYNQQYPTPVAVFAYAPTVPVHAAPKGQQATFPTLSAEQMAAVVQQRPGALSPAHEE